MEDAPKLKWLKVHCLGQLTDNQTGISRIVTITELSDRMLRFALPMQTLLHENVSIMIINDSTTHPAAVVARDGNTVTLALEANAGTFLASQPNPLGAHSSRSFSRF